MPRRSSGGRSASSSSSQPKMRNPPAPAKSAPPPAPATKGGSALGTIGGAITDGIGWGVGTAVAHRAVDALMGPRVIQHEHVSSAPAAPASEESNASMRPDSCNIHSKAFTDCINANGSDISKCQFYLDMLNECRCNSSGMLQA